MIKRYQHKKLVWIDLLKPNQDEIREVMEEFNLHPTVAGDLLSPTLKQTTDLYDNFIYLTLRFPALKHTHIGNTNQEIDFIIGKDFLVTTRYDTIDPVHKFSKVFEVETILEKQHFENAGYVFSGLLKKLYGSVTHELECVQDDLKRTESKIFQEQEREMVKELSEISRDLLNLKQSTNPHNDSLYFLKTVGDKFFGKDFTKETDNIIEEYQKIRYGIKTNRESLEELRETNNSLLSTKQNDTMKLLSIMMAFVTFSLSLTASFLGMSSQFTQVEGNLNNFGLLIGIMVFAGIAIYSFSKYKKWL